jgi:hypothetical protein
LYWNSPAESAFLFRILTSSPSDKGVVVVLGKDDSVTSVDALRIVAIDDLPAASASQVTRASRPRDGVAEVRPFGAMEKNIGEGVY